MRRVPERQFTDAEIEAAVEALNQGGWFGEAHESEVRKAAGAPDDAARAAQIKTLLAEETRMGMLVGVAIGWELARVLELEPDDQTGD